MEIIQALTWDSDFFQLRIGKIDELSKLQSITAAAINLFDLIYIEQTAQNLDTFLENQTNFNITYTDIKTIYRKQLLHNVTSADKQITVYPFATTNDALINLSIQAGAFSRFKLDPNFGATSYKNLYRQWIENAVQKVSADIVLVYGDIQYPKGFITLVFKENLAKVGLIAVDQQHQNEGIGKALMEAAEYFAIKNNFTTLEIITQTENKNACAFYERIGCHQTNILYTHHHWKKHANTI